jgi:hypothetical protein
MGYELVDPEMEDGVIVICPFALKRLREKLWQTADF